MVSKGRDPKAHFVPLLCKFQLKCWKNLQQFEFDGEGASDCPLKCFALMLIEV